MLYPADRLAALLLEFEVEFGAVDVDLQIGVREQLLRGVAEGRVDLAVGPAADGFEARFCREVELIAVARPSPRDHSGGW